VVLILCNPHLAVAFGGFFLCLEVPELTGEDMPVVKRRCPESLI